jgi:hypothetical protein
MTGYKIPKSRLPYLPYDERYFGRRISILKTLVYDGKPLLRHDTCRGHSDANAS